MLVAPFLPNARRTTRQNCYHLSSYVLTYVLKEPQTNEGTGDLKQRLDFNMYYNHLTFRKLSPCQFFCQNHGLESTRYDYTFGQLS